MFFKSGVSTPASIAVLSIATAGVLTTNDYSTIAQFSKMESQIENVKTLSDSFLRRLAKDSTRVIYTMDPNKISAKGAIWTYRSDALSETATTTAGGSWSRSVLKDDIANFNTEEIRVLTTGSNAQCPYHDTGNNKPGRWAPDWNNNPNLENTSLLPCNLFRLTGKGPLGNSTTADILSVHTVAEDNDKWRRITGIEFNIPMDKIITQDNYGSAGPYFLSQVKQTFKGSPVSVSIVKNSKKYGFDPSLFLNSDCSIVNACSLNISYNPKASVEALAGGCNDCVKQDGSNSMNKALTFRNITEATPVIAWKVTDDKEVPDAVDVIAGIINYDTGLEIRATEYDIITFKDRQFEIKLTNAAGTGGTTPFTVSETRVNVDADLEVSGSTTLAGDLNVAGELNLTATGNNYVDFTDALRIRASGSSPAYEASITAFKDGAVDLAHNGVKRLATTSTGIGVSGDITFDASNSKWDKNSLEVAEAIVIKKDSIQVADDTTIFASNDKWIPYPGDEVWQVWSGAQKLEWSRQVPNAYTVSKMIGNILEPFTEQIKTLAQDP